ncbi:MAG: hypothetical protein ACTSYI_12020 [Promethearchaeota archaeon]
MIKNIGKEINKGRSQSLGWFPFLLLLFLLPIFISQLHSSDANTMIYPNYSDFPDYSLTYQERIIEITWKPVFFHPYEGSIFTFTITAEIWVLGTTNVSINFPTPDSNIHATASIGQKTILFNPHPYYNPAFADIAPLKTYPPGLSYETTEISLHIPFPGLVDLPTGSYVFDFATSYSHGYSYVTVMNKSVLGNTIASEIIPIEWGNLTDDPYQFSPTTQFQPGFTKVQVRPFLNWIGPGLLLFGFWRGIHLLQKKKKTRQSLKRMETGEETPSPRSKLSSNH